MEMADEIPLNPPFAKGEVFMVAYVEVMLLRDGLGLPGMLCYTYILNP